MSPRDFLGAAVVFFRRTRPARALPRCDEATLQATRERLESWGVEVSIGDLEAVVYLDRRGVEAAFWPDIGRPGSVYLRANPSRAAVLEEAYHAEQHLRRGWAEADEVTICALEIAAQLHCLGHARRAGWTRAEIRLFRTNLQRWGDQYGQAVRRSDGLA